MSSGPAGSFHAPRRAIPEQHQAPRRRRAAAAALLALFAVMVGDAAAGDARAAEAAPAVPAAMATRLKALDCARVGPDDVSEVLTHVPAPRIVLLQGSVTFVSMEPFARFLIGMGYPAERLRNPRDGRYTYSSFADSAALAGGLAFDYEQSGLEPMLIGHSQGGMLALRVLYEFAGEFHDALPVVDPATGAALPRTTIVDPLTHRARPVVGLHVAYAAALATGWLPRVLLGQWSMLPLLRRVPDTVTEFTGFDVPNDPIAGNLLGIEPYVALGSARVRNVLLPAGYRHIDLPRVDHLADDPVARRWIDAWQPGAEQPLPDGDMRNIVHAADIWHSVRHHWCLQAQRLLTLSSS
jgi:hypothetical protein